MAKNSSVAGEGDYPGVKLVRGEIIILPESFHLRLSCHAAKHPQTPYIIKLIRTAAGDYYFVPAEGGCQIVGDNFGLFVPAGVKSGDALFVQWVESDCACAIWPSLEMPLEIKRGNIIILPDKFTVGESASSHKEDATPLILTLFMLDGLCYFSRELAEQVRCADRFGRLAGVGGKIIRYGVFAPEGIQPGDRLLIQWTDPTCACAFLI